MKLPAVGYFLVAAGLLGYACICLQTRAVSVHGREVDGYQSPALFYLLVACYAGFGVMFIIFGISAL